MPLKDLVAANRSTRRFAQDNPPAMADLEDLVELARLTPSAANRQPLKYFLVADPDACAAVYPCLGWAGYLPDWPGPAENERPTAYVAILHDTTLADSPDCDHGIAAQTIMLGAVEKGFAGCILGSINRDKLAQALDLPDHLHPLLVLALGRSGEEIVTDTVQDSIKYWRDEQNRHHVPKRSLEELVAGRK
ncbi:nitroreductase family protein [Desulfohalovibrio reitneri]|uniref:nitroreductase family protein n=1 Tax=Desulfohalovibrio reitneri TaxID=1307759 RepID=UPI0004A7734B|nr:nitroreductase family protein [Desulfohalovibrio reitneri]